MRGLQIIIILICSTALNANTQATVSATLNHKLPVKDSLELCLKTATDTNRVSILNRLSFQYLKTTNYREALKNAREANRLSVTLNYKKGEAKSYINIGNVYMAQSLLDTAKACYLKSLALAKGISNIVIESHCTNNLGEVYRHQSNYRQALFYYYQSLKIC